MTSAIVLVVLGFVFVSIAAAFLWQENRSQDDDVTIYSVEESIAFVIGGLSDRARANLKRSDVRRILEWEVRYLQDPSKHGGDDPVVVGGLPSAEFAQDQLAARGHPYDGPDIVEVLDLRAEYLVEIGAVGDPLTAAEVAEVEANLE